MKRINEVKFNFRQSQFLKEIDAKWRKKVMTDFAKAKAEQHARRTAALKNQQAEWERLALLMREGSSLNLKKAEQEFKRYSASAKKRLIADARVFEAYAGGKNPRFFRPNFLNMGYGRSAGGVQVYDLWQMTDGGTSVTLPYSDPWRGVMGVQIGTANPGGNSSFNTGLGNFFFSQSAQTIPLAASFIVYGGGWSFSVGAGFSRAWLRLGVEAQVVGPARSQPVTYYFVNDFWSSAPSPWVIEHQHFDYQLYSTPINSIPLLPGDLVLGNAVIEQGCVCGGLICFAKSEFLVSVNPLQIGV